MQLTPQQSAFYDTFGFLAFSGLFAAQVDVISAAFERMWIDSGRTHDHTERSYIEPFADRSEYLAKLIDDPRISGVVSSLLGSDYNYTSSNGNYYVGDTAWHSDQALDAPYHSVKIAVYLDPVGEQTGCIRVIPGSCHSGDAFSNGLHEVVPLTRHNHSEEVWAVHGSHLPAHPIVSTPGDMILFNHKTKHSSWGGGTQRRMFTYNFEQHFCGAQLPHLIKALTASVAPRGVVYGDAMLRTAGPQRMRHLEQRLQVAREQGLISER